MDGPNFPGNSLSPKPEKEEKKLEKVVTGEVTRRKKPWYRRLSETIVAGEATSVGHYILLDVLVPAFKDVVADVVSQGIEKMLYGEARSTSRRTGFRPNSNTQVSYNRYSSPSSRERREETFRPQQRDRRHRGSHNFDDIVLATRHEATEVIDRMFDLISQYDQATVSDLYELVGITGDFTDEKWGWIDFRGAGVTRVAGGYLLDLPKPEPLN